MTASSRSVENTSKQSSADGSDSSRDANSNSLARNVNLFNAKMFTPCGKKGEVDDVNGEGVTANNKNARLSSLEYDGRKGGEGGANGEQKEGQGNGKDR